MLHASQPVPAAQWPELAARSFSWLWQNEKWLRMHQGDGLNVLHVSQLVQRLSGLNLLHVPSDGCGKTKNGCGCLKEMATHIFSISKHTLQGIGYLWHYLQ